MNECQPLIHGRKYMLLGGFGMMILADLVLVMARAPWQAGAYTRSLLSST